MKPAVQLKPHQEYAREWLLQNQRCILADQPRVGKTLPTASASLAHLPALVVCPAIAKRVWERAFNALDSTVAVAVVEGKAAAQQMHLKAGTAAVVVINYDLLAEVPEHAFQGFQTLVLDESHRIKNEKAKRTKAAMKAMRHIGRVYALSGTPVPNRPIELWPLLNGLGIYRGGWYDFASRYAKMWKAPWGMDVSGASNLPELKAMMRPHVLRRKKEHVFTDYNEPQVSLITFDLPVDKREQQFDADALVENPNALLAFEGLSVIMREAGMRKVKPACEFISDLMQSEKKLVVFAHHKDVVAQLVQGLQDYHPVSITGDTPAAQRQRAMDEFQDPASTTRIIVGNIAAMSEGVDLSAADVVVFVEATWQTSALEQASSRVENIAKAGTKPLVYLLTIRASLDHNVLGKVLRKLNVIDQII